MVQCTLPLSSNAMVRPIGIATIPNLVPRVTRTCLTRANEQTAGKEPVTHFITQALRPCGLLPAGTGYAKSTSTHEDGTFVVVPL